ncbi:MAG: WD40 repeat domain-containing protein, partial [Planctomycetia bacterium]
MLERSAATIAATLFFVGAAPAGLPAELRGHDALVYAVAFSPDGKMLASGGFDKKATLWNTDDGKSLRSWEAHGGPVYSLAFAPDGKLLATSGLDGLVRLWNPADGKPAGELKGHANIVDCVRFAPDGK